MKGGQQRARGYLLLLDHVVGYAPPRLLSSLLMSWEPAASYGNIFQHLIGFQADRFPDGPDGSIRSHVTLLGGGV